MPTLLTQKSWKVRPHNSALQLTLNQALGIHPIVAQILINRGIAEVSEAEAFLSSDIKSLHDPFLLKDMDKAVARIRQAREKRERVLIFGDYDVDGVTSTALLYTALKEMGMEAINHIPHRMHDGYGLNEEIGQTAKAQGIKLLIAVDCGITACREVSALRAQGLDVIVIDHHELGPEGLPVAEAVIDPKRRDCSYPFKHLAAVGLVGKLIQAMTGKLSDDELALIALGTIADVVPLTGENRTFVKAGLPRISETKNIGLSALLDVAKIKGKKLRPFSVGFILGPRINATGRMDSAHKSLDLLLSRSYQEAYTLAKFLDSLNSQRQKMQKNILEEAVSLIGQEVNFKEHRVIVLSKEGWHKGVLGIVAARVAEMYSRPTVIISLEEGMGTASARSIEGFHLNEALTHCAQILEGFGGHRLAAGLTIREENIGQFRSRINDFAKDILTVRDLVPTVAIDAEVALSDLTMDMVKQIDLLEPYGEGNPEPVFCSRQVTVKNKPLVHAKDTLKFWVSDGSASVSVVGFGMGKYQEMLFPGQKVDMVFTVGVDDWNKAPAVQIKLKDIQESPA